MIDESNNNSCKVDCRELSVDNRFNTTVQEYIEVVRDLTTEAAVARVKDIAERRGVTRSSVSTALKELHQLGLVNHENYGYVALTDEGRELGAVLSRRHAVILTFLRDILGLEQQFADDEACRLEHSMSPVALDALVDFVRKLEGCPWCDSEPITDGV